MFETVMTSRNLGAEDRCCACKLAEAMLLNLRGIIDEAIPSIISLSMTFILSKNEDEDFVCTNSLYLHSLELVIASLSYSPGLTLQALDSPPPPFTGWLAKFFKAWFKNIPKLTRVYDKKLCLAAICSVIEWFGQSQVADGMTTIPSEMVSSALVIFKNLPEALKR